MFKKGHTPWNKGKRGYNISSYIKSVEHRRKLSQATKNNPTDEHMDIPQYRIDRAMEGIVG